MNEIIINAANKYAKINNCDIIRPAGEQNGFSYFHIDFTGKPKYTGLPVIIKINEAGQIFAVRNLSERMWAVNEEVKQL